MNPSRFHRAALTAILIACFCTTASAAVGDPQVKTDHPWYPGELSCSTFERLFKTQAEVYERVTGRKVNTDEDKALASWYWRNLNYWHGEDGKGDCFDLGFEKGDTSRDYWTGLFANGFGLCGTTHAQWTAEMNALLGHCRSRVVGVTGHNSFEVFLTGGAYGAGRWALLDHDVSTVIFAPDGSRLFSIHEIVPQLKTLKDPKFNPDRQRGWRVAGLHDVDAATYDSFNSVEYLAGYAGAPPTVHLRKGESLRRYLKPGLEDGKTFVFWGRNYRTGGIPGPERSRTWVNQPEKMAGSKSGTGHRDGQARYANAVYTYAPDFAGGRYREGVIVEAADHVTFEFQSPYVIGCTPANDKPWGIYDAGGKNGLVINGVGDVPVRVSTDRGRTWSEAAGLEGSLDLTDLVKGHQQYWLRFDAGVDRLKSGKISWRTVCQCNVAIIPRLREGTNRITFASSGVGLVSAGSNKDQAEAHVVAGKMGSSTVTLELATPRGEKAVRVYAAAWQGSGNPPDDTAYRIECSIDGGKTWKDLVKDWRIVRRGPEPKDFWSQSFCWGEVELPEVKGPVRVRFSNTGGKAYRKVEAHLAYRVAEAGPAKVTFAWREKAGGVKTASRSYRAGLREEDSSWTIDAGEGAETVWVEYSAQ
jgi:hypothetical protein